MRRTPVVILTALLLLPALGLDSVPPRQDPAVIRALIADGDYEQAESAARTLLARAEASSSTRSLEVAAALDLLVEALWRGGKSSEQETLTLARRVVATREELSGSADAALATSLNILGIILSERGDFRDAQSQYERTLSIRRAVLGEEHLDTIKVINNLAALHFERGEYSLARPLLERCLRIREKVLGPNHPSTASSLDRLGVLYREMGDYTRSRTSIDRAIGILEKLGDADDPMLAKSLGDLADLLYVTGDLEGAMSRYERALSIYQKSLDPDDPEIAKLLMHQAHVLLDRADRKGAEALYLRVRKIQESSLGPDDIEVAETIEALADLHREAGDYDKAEPLYRQALVITEKAGESDHPNAVFGQRGLALTLWRKGDLEGAAKSFNLAVETAARALGSSHPTYALVLQDQAAFLRARGDRSSALAAALQSEEISREHVRVTARALSERESLNYAALREATLDLAIALATEGLDGAAIGRTFDALIHSRALVLDEMTDRWRAVTTSGDPEIDRLEGELLGARERLAHLIATSGVEARAPVSQPDLEMARNEAESAERALALRTSGKTGARTLDAGLGEVRRALEPGSALVAYALIDDQSAVGQTNLVYVAFVLRAGSGLPAIVPLGKAGALDDLIRGWGREAAQGVFRRGRSGSEAEAAYRVVAAALRRRLWDPIATRLENASTIFVVPDGLISLVNLAALSTDDGHYLVESGSRIHYLSAERDLALPADRSAGSGSLLVLGDPAFDETSLFASLSSGSGPSNGPRTPALDCKSFASLRLGTLPASAREASDVVSLWNSQKNPSAPSTALSLVGAQASEAAFKKKAPGRRVLHLATHAFFLTGDCLTPRPGTRGVGGMAAASANVESTRPRENPFLLSGLALAGFNHREAAGPQEDDGVLTAEEISAMDLTSVDWAVLSACDTGVGEVKANEGVFGLRRAFRLAGARTLIMSLWPVKDAAAWEWMKNLYQGRVRGISTVEAVSAASREMIERRRRDGESTHPFYWGAFVAAGDWR